MLEEYVVSHITVVLASTKSTQVLNYLDLHTLPSL